MRLTPHEQERLLIHVAADVARARQARGLRLNHPEAMAILLVEQYVEFALGLAGVDDEAAVHHREPLGQPEGADLSQFADLVAV